MATKKQTTRRKTTPKKKSDPLISSNRKKEILGLILMVFSLLLGLALATYSPADSDIARNFSFGAVFQPGNDRAENALGLIGASLAKWLVPGFLGYTSLLLVFLLFVWGYVIFRHRKTLFLPLISVLTVVGSVVLAATFGWLGLTLESDLSLWSGTIGLGIAGWMQQLFGVTGSFLLLILLLAVTLLLVIDHDIQRSIDRIEEAFKALKVKLRTWGADQKDRQLERREERKLARAELKEERAKKREDKEKEAARIQKKAAAQPATPKKPATNKQRPTTTAPIPTPPPLFRDEEPGQPRRTLNDSFRQQVPPPKEQGIRPPDPVLLDAPQGSPEIELKVQERIQEEKADPLDRDVGVIDENLQFEFPPIELLDEPEDNSQSVDYEELEENKQILLEKLATYKIEIVDINAIVGPTVTLYELTPAPGVKISRITSLEDDLAMAMAARGIRMIAPIPGKSAIGVEIPNRHRELVRVRDILGTARFRDTEMELPVALGKSIEGEVYLHDLTKMPHLLIAGATGSGKSVGLNTLIAGLLYACHPSNLKFVMIDPKKIELQQYKELIGHFLALPADGEDAIITDFNDALNVLKSCEKEMERRYDILSKASVRSIKDYNKKLRQGRLNPSEGHRHLPYLVVVVDELADLMMTAGKEIEGPIARLAQMARAVGIHLVLATQRPSVDVITGLIKANFPSRVAYQVASKIDARTILDQNGAEGLVGNGDLLFMNGSKLIRLQGPFVSVDEIDRLMEYISRQPGQGPYLLPPADTSNTDATSGSAADSVEMDALFEEAARIIVRSQQGSVSLLQRKLSVGYTRAARIVDQLEDAGIVGAFVGSKAREVLIADEQTLDAFLADRI